MLPEKASKRGGSRKGKGKKQSKCEISGQAPVLAWFCRELRSIDYTLQSVSPPGKGGGLPYARTHQSLVGRGWRHQLPGTLCSLSMQAKQPCYTKGRTLKTVTGMSHLKESTQKLNNGHRSPQNIKRDWREVGGAQPVQCQVCTH